MPTTNRRMIARDRLTRLFESMSDKRIICVCAPAGHGKTVSVRQWLDTGSRRSAVIPLDEYDNDPAHFCQRFCAALVACQPQNTDLCEIAAHPAFGGAPGEFTLRAIAALGTDERAVVVADDLHFITDDGVLRMFAGFLLRLPHNFQIVLLSRSELSGAFEELLDTPLCAQLGAEHLLFSREEISCLYSARGLSLTDEQTREIRLFTGGWAIGVNALLLSGGAPSGTGLKFLEQFIRQNIWDKWNKRIREFMLCTAAANTLTPSLCEALSGMRDSESLLQELVDSGAFISQADDGSYHYHSLFQVFLRRKQQERGQEFMFSLLSKEGEWRLERQEFYGAVECFIRCANYDGIARCFDLLEITDRNDFIIGKILSVLRRPEVHAAAEKYPFLYFIMSWCALAEGRAEDMADCMDKYYARYPEIARRDPEHAHNVLFMRLIDFRFPVSELPAAVSALPFRSASDGVKGSMTLNMPLLHRSTRDFSELARGGAEDCVAGIMRAVGWLFGRDEKLLLRCMTAGLLYEQGILDRALDHALAARAEARRHFTHETRLCAGAVLIHIFDALGESAESERELERLSAMVERDRAYYLNQNLNALAVRRKLRMGELAAAGEWAAAHGASLYAPVTIHGIYVTFTTCRAYIALGDYTSAIILLAKALDLAVRYKRPLDAVEARILLAIAYWQKKRDLRKEALDYLAAALGEAREYGFVQAFAEDGPELTAMLGQMAGDIGGLSGGPADFIREVYAKSLGKRTAGADLAPSEKTEAYTDRQLMVMRLLCEGKSFRQIAEAMGVTVPTVRSHLALIYKKLDVTREIDAIVKIKENEILSGK